MKREMRKEDARRLAAGEVTPEQLQEENSIFSKDAKMRIHDLVGYVTRTYLPK
ncbi:hypothetical protein ACFQY0_11070 [Haloferula chungangensis]|uniref:Uncharacterized protein n=1 Tax=Haloferula chungangensis TaxID=1048331 RepID=A0ABW2L835_9BACT